MGEKEIEIMSYLNDKIFNPAIVYGKTNRLPKIVRGANYTKLRMSQLPADKMIQYFWSAIVGTDKSINFSHILAENGLTRFEDIIEEFRVKFNNEYLSN